MVDAQKYYNLEKINVEWCAQNNYYNLEKINVQWITTSKKKMLSGLALSPPSRPKYIRPRKNKCRVVWPSFLCLAQNYYDLVHQKM